MFPSSATTPAVFLARNALLDAIEQYRDCLIAIERAAALFVPFSRLHNRSEDYWMPDEDLRHLVARAGSGASTIVDMGLTYLRRSGKVDEHFRPLSCQTLLFTQNEAGGRYDKVN